MLLFYFYLYSVVIAYFPIYPSPFVCDCWVGPPPLGLYNLKLDPPGLSGTGSAPESFAIDAERLLLQTTTLWNSPLALSQPGSFIQPLRLYYPGPRPGCSRFWFSTLCVDHQGFINQVTGLAGLRL